MNTDRDALEQRIRAAFDKGDLRGAATELLEGYGREILGFLYARLRDRQLASDAFSRFTEDLWRGLPGFRWHCAVRVWAYTLARHQASRTLRDFRRNGRHVRISRVDALSEIAARIRTGTLESARTENRNRIAELRERLPSDDQMLLMLRVNRKLPWTDIAHVLFHEGEPVDRAVLQKEAVRLRQRYQSVKSKLRELALAEGLVPDESTSD